MSDAQSGTVDCPYECGGQVDVPAGSLDGSAVACWSCNRDSFVVVMQDGSWALMGEDTSFVEGSVPQRIQALMLGLGFEHYRILDVDHDSRIRLVFRDTSYRQGVTVYTTVTIEDTMEPPCP